MPSYGGYDIFGFAVRMKTVKNPTANQLNEFFGVNGMESLFGGTRGLVTLVQGVLRAPNAFDLKSQELVFVTLDDGQARDLVDTFGYSYSNVLCDGAWEPTSDRVLRDRHSGDFFREYRTSFRHLTNS